MQYTSMSAVFALAASSVVSAQSITFELADIASWDGLGSPNNIVLIESLPDVSFINSVSWTDVTASGLGGPSYGSEMRLDLNGEIVVTFFPDEGSGSAGGEWGPTSGSTSKDFVSNELILEFFESFDDDANLIDAQYTGGTITISYGTLSDCNGNGIPDAEELGPDTDCDGNGVLDSCEDLPDCDGNGVLDSCEDLPDCDGDGISNCGEIAGGAADCDANGIPDSCESGGGNSNEVGVPFDTFVLDGTQASAPFTVQANGSLTSMAIDLTYTNVDADGTWAGDLLIQITDPQGTCVEVGGFNVDLCTEVDDFPAEWDVAASGDYSYTVDFCGTALTGDGTWTFVFVHGYEAGTQDQWAGSLTLEVFSEGGFADCNGNGIEDIEDIANGTSEDCNDNGRPDECDLGPSTDCDGNAILDECETLPDCDDDGVSDCEAIAGGAEDCDANGIPDSCDEAGGTVVLSELMVDTGALNGTEFVEYVIALDGDLDSMAATLTFTNADADGTWAGDVAVQITDPSGACIEVGSYDVETCINGILEDFPAEWNVADSGDYSFTFAFCGQSLSGTGDWNVRLTHGYEAGSDDQWSGTLTFGVFTDEAPCPADLSGDGVVGFSDLSIILSNWLTSDGGDVNGDGETNFSDLSLVLSAWGTEC